MITTYPPHHDGIGTYAAAEVKAAMAAGEEITVVSPVPSAAHLHSRFDTLSGIKKITRVAADHDRAVVQFTSDYFFSGGRLDRRLRVWKEFTKMASVTKLEMRMHEMNYAQFERGSERRAAKRFFKACDRVTVHTQSERDNLSSSLGLSPDAIDVIDHGRNFVAQTDFDQGRARQMLGLDPASVILVSIGYLQYHKGFDRAASSVGEIDASNVQLHIVGSVRTEVPEILDYVDDLESLVDQTRNVFLHKGYVSDQHFDMWIVASDAVVLPYREIWSSSVIERAKLLERPVIVSAVGGLADQAGQLATLIHSDAELTKAIRDVIGGE